MTTSKLLCAVAAALLAAVPAARADEALLTKGGCMACHTKDKKLVGPAFKDIAAKYKGQDASASLVAKVRAGGKGVFGPIPMPPSGADKISDADLQASVGWILRQ
ncbi:c-type cytochrome [Roseateles toxinivorans]|uniref:Cytochrome c n=1 Tax=Roseateles toxinivorans TaxID=270368 RepID=A0A4R6QM91_9BURK|nr:c-type cytochrome [Roseateles toxinivorans]TDP71220.1 cytochrome c [Roseateles toxinivorans]